MAQSTKLHQFIIGDWTATPSLNRLERNGKTVSIEPRAMAVLVYLADRAGQVISKNDLTAAVWNERVVGDDAVYQRIHRLRTVLEDDPHHARYIETIPKKGYRLIAAVESLEQATDDAKDDSGDPGRRRIALSTFLGLILIAAVYVGYQSIQTRPVVSPRLSVEGKTQSEPSAYSIAVLPFRNRSAESEDALFVDGIHDDIVTHLARLSSLERVISRTSVEQYRDTDKSMSQIGQELGVAIILEGSVQRAGDRVRINVQLIDAATDDHLWVESYDRQLTVENLFAIQTEISREVVTALQLVLTDEEDERLQVMPTTSFEAYGEFVLGRHEMGKGTTEAFDRATAHFEKAIELDSNYALAYAALADALGQYAEAVMVNFDDSIAPRQTAIERALALDPLSGEAYASLGFLKLHKGTNEEAEKNFLKAIELSPNYPQGYHGYFILLSRKRLYEEALVPGRKAVELDPMDPRLTAQLAIALLQVGRVEESQSILLKGIRRNPEFPLFYHYMSIDLFALGRIGEAMQWKRASIRLDPSKPIYKADECFFYIQLGDDQSAERCFDSVEQTFPAIAVFSRRWHLYDFRHQFQKSVDVLEQVMQQQDPNDPDLHYMYRLGRSYLDSGDVGKARSIWQELAPELYGDEAVVVKPDSSELAKTALVAYTLYIDGELDRANYLFDQALDTMQSMHRMRGTGYQTWDVFIHVTRGEKQKAISALRDAINTGWRSPWWKLNFPYYDFMREEPEWIELLTELEADIGRQRQWYENHKDDPLF